MPVLSLPFPTARLLSHSEIARELGVAVNTLDAPRGIPEDLVPGLPPAPSPAGPSPRHPALARLLTEHADAPDGALFETAVLDELLRWSSWQPDPPALHFFRTHAGRKVDFVLHSPDRMVAIEVKSTQRTHRTDARPLTEVLGALAARGAARAASQLGLVITRGREAEPLALGVWAAPSWRLFGPPVG
jgi:hypothetical protein